VESQCGWWIFVDFVTYNDFHMPGFLIAKYLSCLQMTQFN